MQGKGRGNSRFADVRQFAAFAGILLAAASPAPSSTARASAKQATTRCARRCSWLHCPPASTIPPSTPSHGRFAHNDRTWAANRSSVPAPTNSSASSSASSKAGALSSTTSADNPRRRRRSGRNAPMIGPPMPTRPADSSTPASSHGKPSDNCGRNSIGKPASTIPWTQLAATPSTAVEKTVLVNSQDGKKGLTWNKISFLMS